MVLGSGLGGACRRVTPIQSLAFMEIPELPATSVIGHPGRLILGRWAGKRVLVFQGRLHFYEGHSWRNVVLPIQTAFFLGVRVLLLTNAAGGIHDALAPGSLMGIRDHIEWNRPYCWRWPGPGGLGPARPSPYSPRLLEILTQAASDLAIPLRQGIYTAVTGPNYETPAEIRAMKAWGADAVGMSTTREIQAGQQLGMECAGLSFITNPAAGLSCGPISHQEVLAEAAGGMERLMNLVEQFLRLL